MGNYVALWDTRMEGLILTRKNLRIVSTNQDVPVTQAIGQINAIAKLLGKIDTMFILCHGWESQDLAHAMFKDEGGWGLEVGKEGIETTNVGLWGNVAGAISDVVIYGCAAANTTRGREYNDGDGRYLMRLLASYTKATVYASPADQTYIHPDHAQMQMTSWKGGLLKFLPESKTPEWVQRAPVEFNEVISGAAP